MKSVRSVNQLKISENDRKAVLAASKMLTALFPAKEIILFGSKARGDDDDESDIDFLLLTSRPISWEERKAVNDALFEFEMSYNVVISTLIATEQEWYEGTFSVMPIFSEVETDGIVI